VVQVNKVAVRFKDGRVMKGTTRDFMPGKGVFHLAGNETGKIIEVRVEDLKAVFFVKDFEGRADYSETKRFPGKPPTAKGRKIAVLFDDGELLTGFTLGYDARRLGFFMLPTDEMSNNDRIYVLRSAVKEVGMGPNADQIIGKHLPA
jgi:hypothetical protein